MGKFLTGHDIFDFISSIQEGSAILILDETGFESIMLTNALLRNFPNKDKVVFISAEPITIDFKVERIELEKIPDVTVLSLEMEKVRQALKGKGVIIHGYLPHVLIREEEDRILKIVESWRERALNSKIVEIFLLRRDAFPSFEKRLQTLVAGSILIKVKETGKQSGLSFRIVGGSKPEYHIQDFPFHVKEDRLLIKWRDEFTDRLPLEGKEAIENKLTYLKENVNSLRVTDGGKVESSNPYDRWLFSQVKGKRLAEISIVFPEKLDEVLRKLAAWNIKGYIKFELIEGELLQPIRDRLKLLNRIALAFPTTTALSFFRKRTHTIPMKVYNTLRKSVEAFMSTQLPGKNLSDELSEIEMNFQEMTARLSAIETILEIGEDPRIKLDLKYLPKIIALIMYYGYGLKPKVKKVNNYEYQVYFQDCFICSEYKGKELACQLLAGTMIGGCSIMFKESFICREVECKGLGAEACVFELKVDKRSGRVQSVSDLFIPSSVKPSS